MGSWIFLSILWYEYLFQEDDPNRNEGDGTIFKEYMEFVKRVKDRYVVQEEHKYDDVNHWLASY